jgi:predicted dehydrogenase
MDNVRFGIIGLGNMGSHHAKMFGNVKNATLAAVADNNPARFAQFASQPGIKTFERWEEMFASGLIDAVLVATPHYSHVPISEAAFARGLHVLCEKPVAVSVKAARHLNDVAAKYPKLKFGVMLNLRTVGMYTKLRELIAGGELGEIRRITWVVTDIFRSFAYYASGGWRATWSGEGGGVLINQCPHTLDLIQWVTGLKPSRVTAMVGIGKMHPIEVEDDVSAMLEYSNGAVGHFITNTAEMPGTNRLEIAGDRGRIVAEKDKISFSRTRQSVQEYNQTTPEIFAQMESWDIDVPFDRSSDGAHWKITQNFVNAILRDEPMIAPGTDGILSLELGNAMLMSGVNRTSVDLPIDGDAYDRLLLDLARKYGGKKNLAANANATMDFGKSFGR